MMAPQEPEVEQSFQDWWNGIIQQPRMVVIYGVLTVVSAMLVWGLLPHYRIEVPFFLLPLFVGFLLFARVWTIGLILLLLLVVGLLNEPRTVDEQIALPSILFALGIVSLVITACRYYVCTAPLTNFQKPTPQRKLWPPWRIVSRPQVPTALQPRQPQHFQPGELLTGALRVLLPVAIAMVLLWLTPLDRAAVTKYRLTPPGVRVIMMSVSLFFVVMLTNGLLGIFAWKRLSAAAARVYLRSVLTQFLQTDFRMVIKRRLKLRRSRMKG